MAGVAQQENSSGSEATHRYAIMRVPKVAVLAPLVVMICATPIAMAIPELSVIYLVPIGIIVALVRRRTTADTEGITVRTTFGKRFLPWSQLSGLTLTKRSTVRAVRADGAQITLPSVRTRHLPALSVASGGRISDPAGLTTYAAPSAPGEGTGAGSGRGDGGDSGESGASNDPGR